MECVQQITECSTQESVQLAHESSPHPKSRGKSIDEHQRALGKKNAAVRNRQIHHKQVSLRKTKGNITCENINVILRDFSYYEDACLY